MFYINKASHIKSSIYIYDIILIDYLILSIAIYQKNFYGKAFQFLLLYITIFKFKKLILYYL